MCGEMWWLRVRFYFATHAWRATRENVRLPQFGPSVDQLPLSPASEVVTMCSVGWRAVKWMHA